jgi:hypothetical protein
MGSRQGVWTNAATESGTAGVADSSRSTCRVCLTYRVDVSGAQLAAADEETEGRLCAGRQSGVEEEQPRLSTHRSVTRKRTACRSNHGMAAKAATGAGAAGGRCSGADRSQPAARHGQYVQAFMSWAEQLICLDRRLEPLSSASGGHDGRRMRGGVA